MESRYPFGVITVTWGRAAPFAQTLDVGFVADGVDPVTQLGAGADGQPVQGKHKRSNTGTETKTSTSGGDGKGHGGDEDHSQDSDQD